MWILVSIIILCSISIWAYTQIITYSPENMNLIHEEWEYAKQVTNHIIKMTDLIWNREELSIDDVVKISEKMNRVNKVSWQLLFQIFSINPNIVIESYLVYKSNDWMSGWLYVTKEDIEKEYYNLLRTGESVWVSLSEIENTTREIEYWKWYDKIYYDYKNWTSDAWSVFNYRSSQWWNVYTYEDYRWIKEWFLIVLFTIIWFLGIILFTYISRWIFYYIVLWSFFPKK